MLSRDGRATLISPAVCLLLPFLHTTGNSPVSVVPKRTVPFGSGGGDNDVRTVTFKITVFWNVTQGRLVRTCYRLKGVAYLPFLSRRDTRI